MGLSRNTGEKNMNKTLDGIKVIELAQYISGPYCGMLFAGLGANVTKIEEPGIGDISRRCGRSLKISLIPIKAGYSTI